MKHTESFRVRFHDTDLHENAKPSALLALMQECANMQMEKYGQPLDVLHDKGLCFIVVRLEMHIFAKIKPYDTLTAEAWTCPSKGFTFRRNMRLSQGGETVADAATLWALLDKNNGTFVRTDDFTYNFTHDEQTIPDPRRLRLPQSEMRSAGRRRVVYSDADYNLHMNNTAYPNMLCDFLPPEVLLEKAGEARLSSIVIDYKNEARVGDELEVFTADDGGRYFFKTVKSDGSVNIEAEVDFI